MTMIEDIAVRRRALDTWVGRWVAMAEVSEPMEGRPYEEVQIALLTKAFCGIVNESNVVQSVTFERGPDAARVRFSVILQAPYTGKKT